MNQRAIGPSTAIGAALAGFLVVLAYGLWLLDRLAELIF